MACAARWIRASPAGAGALQAMCSGLAQSQCARAAPAVVWARAEPSAAAVPGDVGERRFTYAVIAPLRLAPGRRSRWRAWALAPALGVYRQFGACAYLEDGDIYLHGQRVATCAAKEIGACVVVISGFPARRPDGLAAWPARDLEGIFRGRVEAQYDWEFDNSWPSASERLTIADAMMGEPADAK